MAPPEQGWPGAARTLGGVDRNEKGRPKVIVVLPAYNAEKTLARTLRDIPAASVDEVILVDDFSLDGTLALAASLGLTPIAHHANRGYGANQKTCYREALARDADVVVMLHPDYQYDPRLIPHFTRFLAEGYFDVMLGNRIRSRREALDGGMPAYKYYANRVLTLMQNVLSGQNLGEWHTGYRAFTREVLEQVPFESFSDDFVFDTEMLFAVVELGFRLGEVPVPVRYFAEASSINAWRSVVYGLSTLRVALGFALRRLFGGGAACGRRSRGGRKPT